MADISREEFTGWMQTLRDDIAGVQDRLDKLNDRTRTAEQTIAVLGYRATVGQAAVYGGGSAGVVTGLIEGLKWWLGK